jgi:hypothetical protein
MKPAKILSIFFLIITANHGFGQDISKFFNKADRFFESTIKNGKVDYDYIKSNPKDLNELLDLAQGILVSKENPQKYQAFWINTYNLSVIKGIVENYPLKSPLDVPGFFDKKTYVVGGEKRTLNDIENKLLRENFIEEARFHFVLVCGALGCPPIVNRAYLPETLEDQLERQTKLSINNPNFVRLEGNELLLSQIFEWYKDDFIKGGKSLIDFVNQYRKEKIAPNKKVRFYPYDWSLNKVN